MSIVAIGSKVRVNYTTKLEDGTVFDSSERTGPVEFILGGGSNVPPFANELIGMRDGESKITKMSVDEAYGRYMQEESVELDRSSFLGDIAIKQDQLLFHTLPDGTSIPFEVVEITKSMVKLMPTHPLAGRELQFEIQLLEIVDID